MTAEQTITHILSKHPEASREEIVKKLEKERHKTNGLISDEILLRIIAAELGVEIENNKAPTPTLSAADLVPNLNNVTVTGRVIAVFPPKAFNGHKKGKIASFLIADKHDILRIVLWNDKTSLVEKNEVKVGRLIRISRGYTKEGPGGVEVHVGERSRFDLTPQDLKEEDYPAAKEFNTKIADVTQASRSRKVNLNGVVKKLFPTSTFERQDSSTGKVMRLILADEGGEIPVVVWNEKVDELCNVKEGDRLQIINARTRKAQDNGTEVHIDAGAYVESASSTEEFCKIADLREGLWSINIEGEVAEKPILREIKTSKEEIVQLASFEIKDETGSVCVSAWRKHAVTVSNLKAGEKIVIRNAYLRKGFSDILELSTRDITSITFTE
ncbi:MAG TPA: OB-fold nucleic acid binding domain-containing protein [Candidatus Bathyarchaeia archaeon]|nr:OB-fold nucleic acid binding domain-containing protein [Candidatus Bathyarchaeia archaeon]